MLFMRMVHQSPTKLVLMHRPMLLCVALGAGAVLLLGVTLWNVAQAQWLKAALGLACTLGLIAPAIWFATERVDVTFDAHAQTVSLRIKRLSGQSDEVIRLADLEKAMVQTHVGPSDSASAHRVALVRKPGGPENILPLTTGYASGRGATDIVARINTWLEQTQAQSDA